MNLVEQVLSHQLNSQNSGRVFLKLILYLGLEKNWAYFFLSFKAMPAKPKNKYGECSLMNFV